LFINAIKAGWLEIYLDKTIKVNGKFSLAISLKKGVNIVLIATLRKMS